MSEAMVRLGEGGRLVIPGEIRAALGIEPGDVLVLVLDDDGLHVLTRAQAVQRAQALVARYVGRQRSLSQELLDERERER